MLVFFLVSWWMVIGGEEEVFLEMSSEDCVGIKKYKEIDGDGNGVVVLAFEEGRTPAAEAQRE